MMARMQKTMLIVCLLAGAASGQGKAPLDALKAWLGKADRPPLEEQDFARAPLTRADADEARKLLIDDLARRLRTERAAEWKAKRVTHGDHAMRFDYRRFGEAPQNGRRLFISMHGGGGAPAEVNDQQWRNQIRLYEPAEGIYLAPRAPTDTWNLWHQAHIDPLFERIIEDAVLFEGVSFDRVYLMGYSAGGDGVYQLAPRLSDRFAAAAMMAGHPNETRPVGLRNLPFTLHMGAKDGAYDRNAIAARWKDELAALRRRDREGYRHEVVIHAGKGHWMDRQDAVAVPWMTRFTRVRRPDRVVWRQDDVLHDRLYWVGMPKAARKAGVEAHVAIKGSHVIVEKATTATALTLWLDDELIDLDAPVKVSGGGVQPRTFEVERTLADIAATLALDPARVFYARIDLAL